MSRKNPAGIWIDTALNLCINLERHLYHVETSNPRTQYVFSFV